MDSHLRPELARMVQAAMSQPDRHVPFFADSREDVLSPETLGTVVHFLDVARNHLSPEQVPPAEVDLETVYLAACYFWARCRFLPEEDAAREHQVSLALLAIVHAIRPEAVPQPRRAQFARHPPGLPPVAGILHGTAMIFAAASKENAHESGLWTAVALTGYARASVTGAQDPVMVFDHGALFADLFAFTGDPDHFRAGIALMRKAIAAFPSGEAPEAMLTVLARTQEKTPSSPEPDLGVATATARHSLAGADPASPVYGQLLAELGELLHKRFEASGEIGDLAESIRCLETAVATTPAARHDQPVTRIKLAMALAERGRHARQQSDIDRARALLRELTTDPSAAEAHRQLAGLELARLPDRPWNPRADLVAATAEFEKTALTPAHDIPARLRAAYSWGLHSGRLGQLDQANQAFGLALDELLPKLAGHTQGRTREIPSPACDAAAVALERGNPAEALVRLEHGRAVVLAEAVRLRPHADLVARHPELARRFEQACATLNRETVSVRVRRRAAADFRETVAEIRSLPGFDRFLQRRDFWSLRKAAAHGPVAVVNVAELGCAALLLSPGADAPEVMPLPGITRTEVFHRTEAFLAAVAALSAMDSARAGHDRTVMTTLEWLWDHIAGPVLKALDLDEHSIDEQGPRLWWCPTGPLSLLPLHAARCGADDSYTCDRVVSSYTTTLGALLDARTRRRTTTSRLGVAYAASHASLPAIREELEALSRPESLLVGAEATPDAVLTALRSHRWAHLACPAEHAPADPSRSGFALHDGFLALRELAAEPPRDAEFAFLSACHTAAWSPAPGDEVVPLAGAVQLCGYRHVIGGLWTAAAVRPLIAGEVYRDMTTADDAALALHRATRRLRSEPRYSAPPFWASFVHFGP
ncbi:CHAT domain-containing protein [Amycolatopsis sp. NPDC059021]|uniref:CHAT domain-containing protein n=1 Tax=Amycolatopsis sp. NPDC059021 TaxID=3346704 RepID=UPI00366FD8B3